MPTTIPSVQEKSLRHCIANTRNAPCRHRAAIGLGACLGQNGYGVGWLLGWLVDWLVGWLVVVVLVVLVTVLVVLFVFVFVCCRLLLLW